MAEGQPGQGRLHLVKESAEGLVSCFGEVSPPPGILLIDPESSRLPEALVAVVQVVHSDRLHVLRLRQLLESVPPGRLPRLPFTLP